jgi:putative RecB family exonuclease
MTADPSSLASDAVPPPVAVPAAGEARSDGREDRRRRPGLSPSRANDFAQCPLLFRYRVVDRLPEPPSSAAVRGTLVHSVLERLYDAPLGERTVAHAESLLPGEWARLQEAQPEYGSLFGSSEEMSTWLGTAGSLVRTYFTLEDPNRLEPAEREMFLESQLDGGPLLRGVVDRLDVAPDGAVRVVDYKSGKSPRAGYASSAEFQMRFYGLVVWRERGVVPRMLQLVYLGDGQVLRNEPTEADLVATERRIRSVWGQIQSAGTSGDFRPRRTPLCGWCAHKTLCPEFGGTPPVLDPDAVERALGVRPSEQPAGR